MLVRITSETSLELSDTMAPDLRFESDGGFGPIEMFIASIGLCAFSVLASYAEQAEVAFDRLRLSMDWRYADDVNRIEHISLCVRWPELPPQRADAAARAAETCTLHRTLGPATPVETRVVAGGPGEVAGLSA